MTGIRSALSTNRAEELGYDVWEDFVVPPFFGELGLYENKQPKLIVGGRGCGKTMLLRYLAHQSAFSPARRVVPDEALLHIGLYWRADTQFANAMQRRAVSPETWASAFQHFAALLLSLEVLRSLDSIATSNYEHFSSDDLARLSFSDVRAFDDQIPSKFSDLEESFHRRIHQLEAWVSDVRKAPEPRFLPGTKFVVALIDEVRHQSPALENARFFVYLDEYENLIEYQQEIVNTWVKFSQVPLIFNLAMKRNGFQTRKTVGTESLSDIHDFRQHDIESHLENQFECFAAEILFLRLSKGGAAVDVDVARLHDPSRLTEREDPKYRSDLLKAASRLLPDVSEEQLAAGVFSDKTLSQKLRERIETALKAQTLPQSFDDFFRPESPKASIITPALLFRKNLSPEFISAEFDRLEEGATSKFENWIHNNFIGCLLQLYEPFSRACPFYAGFRTFCHLANGNIRYFLELCHRSVARATDLTIGVSPEDQAEVARQASTSFLKEIRSFGTKGNQLYSFVLGLGSLFAFAHLRDTQSESEQTHFFVREGHRALSNDDLRFLEEAVKWSVLFESEATKLKSEYEAEGLDYTLNPIYAPYFHISYRKRRKLELGVDDLHILIEGEYSKISELLKRYRSAWSITKMSLPLFSHLED
jgi:hypothetical protein